MTLPEPFTIEGGAVLYRGRAVKGVDAATFEVLDDAYARDASSVLLVMASKLKPLKGLDSASFEALGGRYGRDANGVCFDGKRVRLKKGGGGSAEAFRWLGSCYGTDGHWMYFGTQQCEPPRTEGIDWERASYHPFEENVINRSDAVFTDGAQHFFWLWRGGWIPIQEISMAGLTRLGDGLIGLHERCYMTDGQRVWFRGRPVEGVAAASARQIGLTALEDGSCVFGGAERTEFRLGELRWLGDTLYRTESSLIEIDRDGEVSELAQSGGYRAPSVEAAFGAFAGALLKDAMVAFDRYLPVEASPHDIDFDQEPAGGVPELRSVSFSAGQVSVQWGEESRAPISIRPSAWFALLCAVWCEDRGREGALRAYVNYSTGYPDADALHVRLSRRAALPLVDLVAALHAAGERDEALALSFLLMVRAEPASRWSGLEESLHTLAVRMPLDLVEQVRFERPQDDFTVTTNLGVAKQVAALGLIEHEDLRVRWTTANLVTGILRSTNKTGQALKLLAERMLAQADVEPVGIVREAWWIALESAAVAVNVDADIAREFAYAELERLATALIESGVNVDQQRVRLVEALFGQARFEESQVALEGLRELDCYADGGRLGPAPGPFCNRVRYRSYEAAGLAAQVRALFAPSIQPEARRDWIKRLHARIEELAEREAPFFGPLGKRGDLGDALRDLYRLSEGD